MVLAARKIAEITCPMELALADDVRLRSERKGAQTHTKPKHIYYMICDRLNERGVTAKRTQCKQMETKPSLPLIKVFFRLEGYAQKREIITNCTEGNASSTKLPAQGI